MHRSGTTRTARLPYLPTTEQSGALIPALHLKFQQWASAILSLQRMPILPQADRNHFRFSTALTEQAGQPFKATLSFRRLSATSSRLLRFLLSVIIRRSFTSALQQPKILPTRAIRFITTSQRATFTLTTLQ